MLGAAACCAVGAALACGASSATDPFAEACANARQVTTGDSAGDGRSRPQPHSASTPAAFSQQLDIRRFSVAVTPTHLCVTVTTAGPQVSDTLHYFDLSLLARRGDTRPASLTFTPAGAITWAAPGVAEPEEGVVDATVRTSGPTIRVAVKRGSIRERGIDGFPFTDFIMKLNSAGISQPADGYRQTDCAPNNTRWTTYPSGKRTSGPAVGRAC